VLEFNEYLRVLDDIRSRVFGFQSEDPYGPWYRGQTKAEWPLLPKLYRPEFGGFGYLVENGIETEIMEEFVQRGGLLTNIKPQGDGAIWDWYFLMQHFGAPTRLLDWTESSLVALYFALKDNPGCYDSAVWVFDPFTYNSRKPLIEEAKVFSPNSCITAQKHKDIIDKWLPHEGEGIDMLPNKPLAIYPAQVHQRMAAQLSCFTIHGKALDGLTRYEHKRNDILVKVVIPAFAVLGLRKQLARCGIDEASVYPDLVGLGESLNRKWLLERDFSRTCLPHNDVKTRLAPSKIDVGGVGVFAITQIKRGTKLFQGDLDELCWVNRDSLRGVQMEIRKLYNQFSVYNAKRRQFGCPTSFNRMTMSWYINSPKNGDKPNVTCDAKYDFYALRNIRPGEELTVDYSTYNDPI
jgi:hypothetical protein